MLQGVLSNVFSNAMVVAVIFREPLHIVLFIFSLYIDDVLKM